MLAMLFEITKPAFGSKPCPHCDIKELDSSLFHHLMETHSHYHVLVQEDPAEISVVSRHRLRLRYFLYC